MNRKELHWMVDKLPEDKLPRLSDFFQHIFDEDKLELNDTTKKEIDQARERINKGEYVTLADLLKDLQDV
ncbi:hypothetical protein F3157_13400 [Virgibacillus dakarensis]|nr:hypothetical protein [Virgibacillus dakarensis]